MISFTPFDPTFLTIGPLQFRYYGLFYIIVFYLTYLYIYKRKDVLEIDDTVLWDIMFYGILGVILGGRIGYIIFYNLQYFIANPLKMVAVWEGGMSFHGGLIGVIFSTYIYCKKKNLNFLKLADSFILPISFGLGIARFGNFINGELYGRTLETTFYVPWGMVFKKAGDNMIRHPSQLYEVAKNFIIFITLFLIRRKNSIKDGIILTSFLILYGCFRFIIEFVREPDPQLGLFLGYFSMGQFLSISMVFIGIIMYFRCKNNYF